MSAEETKREHLLNGLMASGWCSQELLDDVDAAINEAMARALAESEKRVRVLEFDRDKLLEAGGIALMIRPDLIRDGSLSLFSALEPLRHAVESVESDRMDAALLKGEPDARPDHPKDGYAYAGCFCADCQALRLAYTPGLKRQVTAEGEPDAR